MLFLSVGYTILIYLLAGIVAGFERVTNLELGQGVGPAPLAAPMVLPSRFTTPVPAVPQPRVAGLYRR
jgi:hypothetical protein